MPDWVGYAAALFLALGFGLFLFLALATPQDYKVQFCQDTVIDGVPTQQCWHEWVPEDELPQP